MKRALEYILGTAFAGALLIGDCYAQEPKTPNRPGQNKPAPTFTFQQVLAGQVAPDKYVQQKFATHHQLENRMPAEVFGGVVYNPTPEQLAGKLNTLLTPTYKDAAARQKIVTAGVQEYSRRLKEGEVVQVVPTLPELYLTKCPGLTVFNENLFRSKDVHCDRDVDALITYALAGQWWQIGETTVDVIKLDTEKIGKELPVETYRLCQGQACGELTIYDYVRYGEQSMPVMSDTCLAKVLLGLQHKYEGLEELDANSTNEYEKKVAHKMLNAARYFTTTKKGDMYTFGIRYGKFSRDINVKDDAPKKK